MSVTHIMGDLLKDPSVSIVCHQVNCQGRMGSGIAKSIKEKWPVVFDEYRQWHWDCQETALRDSGGWEFEFSASDLMLGKVLLVDVGNNQKVANLAAQEWCGYDGKRYTSYDAFWNCLHELRMQVTKNDIIGFPKGIGCGLGGANWNIIEAMIKEVFKDYDVRIYELL